MKSMTETQTEPRLRGLFEWCDGKSIHIQARFDKVALHQDKLVFISLVAASPGLKALRAALASGLAAPMWLKNVSLLKDGEPKVPESVVQSPTGYRIDAHRLRFGLIHALFTCRQQGFLQNDSDDALWQELKQERFTTPLLRRWLPYVRKGAGAQEPALPLLHARLHLLYPDRHIRRPGLDRRIWAEEWLDLNPGGSCVTPARPCDIELTEPHGVPYSRVRRRVIKS
jgi:hypothetical protein